MKVTRKGLINDLSSKRWIFFIKIIVSAFYAFVLQRRPFYQQPKFWNSKAYNENISLVVQK